MAGSSKSHVPLPDCSIPLIEVEHLRKVGENHSNARKLNFNQDSFDSICTLAGGRPVSIIGICGPRRLGKSFLMNYLIRRLVALEKGQTDWIGWEGDRKHVELKGFSYGGGGKCETSGIWIWSKPFILRNDEGKEVAVLLLDTQGVYDEDLMGLCLLTSSITILNLNKDIPETVWNSLQTYISFGKLVLDSSGMENEVSPFQKLVFLIRDWKDCEEYPFGNVGGTKFLQDTLQKKFGQESLEDRKLLQKCFHELDCFLMPEIGMWAKDPKFTGSVFELLFDFARQVEVFINVLVSSSTLVPKKIVGRELTARNLKPFLERYVKLFNLDKKPSATDLWQSTYNITFSQMQKDGTWKRPPSTDRNFPNTDVHGTTEKNQPPMIKSQQEMAAMVSTKLEDYKAEMMKLLNNSKDELVSEEKLLRHHSLLKKEALLEFQTDEMPDNVEKFIMDLADKIEDQLELMKKRNVLKQKKIQARAELCLKDSQKLYVEMMGRELEAAHRGIAHLSKQQFVRKCPGNGVEEFLVYYQKKLDTLLNQTFEELKSGLLEADAPPQKQTERLAREIANKCLQAAIAEIPQIFVDTVKEWLETTLDPGSIPRIMELYNIVINIATGEYKDIISPKLWKKFVDDTRDCGWKEDCMKNLTSISESLKKINNSLQYEMAKHSLSSQFELRSIVKYELRKVAQEKAVQKWEMNMIELGCEKLLKIYEARLHRGHARSSEGAPSFCEDVDEESETEDNIDVEHVEHVFVVFQDTNAPDEKTKKLRKDKILLDLQQDFDKRALEVLKMHPNGLDSKTLEKYRASIQFEMTKLLETELKKEFGDNEPLEMLQQKLQAHMDAHWEDVIISNNSNNFQEKPELKKGERKKKKKVNPIIRVLSFFL